MPIYTYQHPQTQVYKDILQGMNDDHVYIDEEGGEWKRIFYVPQMSMDTEVDPHSSSDYLKATANKKGTLGDLMDYSKELSEQRASKEGKDPVRDKFLKEYQKNTGRKHISEAKTYESDKVKVEYD